MTNYKRTTELAIEPLSDVDKLQLIDEYEQFERDGYIGDCNLRSLAQGLPGAGLSSESTVMTLLANECYRYFASLYLNSTVQGANIRYNYSKKHEINRHHQY